MLAPDFIPPAGWTPRAPMFTESRPYLTGAAGVATVRHEDWSAMLEFCTRAPHPAWTQPTSRSERSAHAWDLGAGWDGAVALARTGWPEGRARMAEAVQGAADLARFDTAPVLDRDVAGAYPIVPVALAGDPCAMVMPADLDTSRRPVVRVVCNTSRSGMVKADAIANLFGAVLSCLDAMEAAGQSVELTLADPFGGSLAAGDGRPAGAGMIVQETVIKRAGEPLELDRVAFAMAHPACYRRLGFRFLEQFARAAPLFPGYGHVVELDPADLEPGTIYVPCQHGSWANACVDRAHALAHALHFFNNPIGSEAGA